MDDDDDDARFCLNRSSDDDGRRGPSVSAMAAPVDRPTRRVRSRAHVRWIRTQHASAMKWAPWSTLNGSLSPSLGLKLAISRQSSTARLRRYEWCGRQDRGARRCIDGRGRYVTHPLTHARTLAASRFLVAVAPPFDLSRSHESINPSPRRQSSPVPRPIISSSQRCRRIRLRGAPRPRARWDASGSSSASTASR